MAYNITRQQALERAPLLRAWGEGATLQYYSGFSWCDCIEDGDILSDGTTQYRIKPIKQLRPWKPEEVPMPCILRNKTTHHRYAVLAVIDRGLYTISNGNVTINYFCDLIANTEHSLDHGKTWLPCGVLE